jgi:hypothetical protein
MIPYFDSLRGDNSNTIISEIKTQLKEILKYDYLITPFEGIYINENIIGLIKYLSGQLLKQNSNRSKIPDVLDSAKVKQPEMTLEDQRNIVRLWLMNKNLKAFYAEYYASNKKTLNELFGIRTIHYDNAYLTEERPPTREELLYNNVYSPIPANDIVKLVKQQRYLIKNTYISSKIFNFDKPIITDILEPYIEDSSESASSLHNKSAIKDFKVFYLLGNYDEQNKTDFKCEHQIKLLDNTKNFIQAIAQ